MRLGELFAGYGGLGLAVEEVFGAELAWVSEWEAAPSKILAHHWPHVPNYGDVTKIDWANIEPVDIISGGSPCQDLSLAGKRRGMNEGTRSNLWESMREGIAVIKPKYVVWENVRGALSAKATSDSDMESGAGLLGNRDDGHLRALGRVLGDLADLGFDAEWRSLRASDVGAPHGRFRVFVLAAHPGSERTRIHSRASGQEREQAGTRGATLVPPGNRTAASERHQPSRYEFAANPNGLGRERCREAWGWGLRPEDSGEPTANAICEGLQGPHDSSGTSQAERHGHPSAGIDWGRYSGAIRRWETVRGAAPTPIERNPRGGVRLSADLPEWMMGLPEGWITDVPGVSRADQLKAAGNGVVPQQAAAALRDMLAAFEAKEIAA